MAPGRASRPGGLPPTGSGQVDGGMGWLLAAGSILGSVLLVVALRETLLRPPDDE
jgi:hypothetical protein